ncbi:MAG: phage major capsid protein [Actinomycetota bacterium]
MPTVTLDELRAAAEAEANQQNLEALRDAVASEMRGLHEEIGEQEPTEEQQRRWTELEDEHQRAAEQIETLTRVERVRESRARWGAVQFGQRVEPFADLDVRSLPARAAQDRALSLLDRRDEGMAPVTDEQRTRLERLFRTRNANCDGSLLARRMLVTEHPDYREAFMRLVTRATPVLTPEQGAAVQRFEEIRAMSIGTDDEGGFGVPVVIDPTIILTAQGHPNPFMAISRVETITTDRWRGVSSSGVSWQFRAEEASATDDAPTLAQPEVPAHRADGYIPYSFEVEMDYPGFAMEMQRLLGEGYSELLVEEFSTGDGSDAPTGIITALDGTGSEIDNGTTEEIDADDINGLWAALPIKYRNPAGAASQAWMGHTSVNNVVQQLGSGGDDSSFTVDFTAEGVTVLKGRRWFLNDYFDELNGAATGLVVVGDWRNFLIAQRAGMSIELIPHVIDTSGSLGVPTGQRAWFAWARVGSDSINDDGFRMLSDDDA